MGCIRKQCYFCQVFAAKIGSGRSLPYKGCNRCNRRRHRVTLVRRCPEPIRCHDRCQEGVFASDWDFVATNYRRPV